MKRILSSVLFVLVALTAMAQDITFSTADAPVYYLVKFTTGGAFLKDQGNGQQLITASTPTQSCFWAFIGTKTGFTMLSADGNYVNVNSSNYFASTSTASKAQKLAFINGTASGQYEIKTQNGSGQCVMNQWGGGGSGKSLGKWNAGDTNNQLVIMNPDDVDLTDYSALLEKAGKEFKTVSAGSSTSFKPANPLTLWYTKPATMTTVENKWMEYSLPIGNGHLGACLFGGAYCDQLQFNEKSLWSGASTVGGDHGYYQNFGSVYVIDESNEFSLTATSPRPNKYVRFLDIEDGVAGVNFTHSTDGGQYYRRYLSSEPDDVIAAHYVAPEGHKLAFQVSYYPGENLNNSRPVYADGYGEFHGKLGLLNYNTQLRVVPVGEGATLTEDEMGIHVANADEVLVLLSAKTDYDGTNMSTFANGETPEQLHADIRKNLDNAAAKGWERLLADHTENFRSYMGRVKLNLNTGTVDAASTKTTEALVTYYNQSSSNPKTKDGLFLEQLYFQYGRYLGISCSRGSLPVPSNLQGLWNDKANAPWHSDIHTNINVQMNYWPMEPTNLSECHMPYLDYIINMVNSPGWKRAASNAGNPGWTVYTESNIFGGMSGWMSNYVVANAWYCTHLWQHYRYTLDKAFLKRAFPAMWGAAQFWLSRLKKNSKDGTYECPAEFSPENHDVPSEDATAHAQQLVLELLQNTKDAYDILGAEATGLTAADVDKLTDRLINLDNGLHTETYDGAWGADWHGITNGMTLLREWKTSPYSKAEKNHRHQSHLMCLYPFNQVYPGHEYFEAAVNSLQHRGDDATGWSLGWKVNLWARAQNGDHAHTIIQNALKHSTTYGTNQAAGGVYYNLFDSHAPFQIDGNFGTCAGIAEMLMQSCTGTISILPALPAVWPKGSVSGLKAVGDFTVSIEWAKKQPTYVTIVNNQGQPLKVTAPLSIGQYPVYVNGAEVTPAPTADGAWEIPSTAGDIITIDFAGLTSIQKQQTTDNGQQTTVAYDLQGRALKTSPFKGEQGGLQRGVFVKNGNKVLR